MKYLNETGSKEDEATVSENIKENYNEIE